MADVRKPEASWLSTEVPRFGLMSASRRTPLYQQGLLLPPNRTNWAAALMLDALPGGLQGEFGSATNPSASAVISTWLFVAVRQCESCPDPGLGCCDSYLNLGFTKSTVRLSLTDYNKSPPDCNVECGSCSLRLLLAIEISPPAHAITSPPAPTCAAIDLVRFDHARCIFWDRCVSNRKLLNTYFGDIAVLYLVIPAVMSSSPNGD
jgi:hypothetical protein